MFEDDEDPFLFDEDLEHEGLIEVRPEEDQETIKKFNSIAVGFFVLFTLSLCLYSFIFLSR